MLQEISRNLSSTDMYSGKILTCALEKKTVVSKLLSKFGRTQKSSTSYVNRPTWSFKQKHLINKMSLVITISKMSIKVPQLFPQLPPKELVIFIFQLKWWGVWSSYTRLLFEHHILNFVLSADQIDHLPPPVSCCSSSANVLIAVRRVNWPVRVFNFRKAFSASRRVCVMT